MSWLRATPELLEAARATLRDLVMPAVPPERRYEAAMVAHAIGVAVRELREGPAAREAERADLAALLGADPAATLDGLRRELCRAIRAGDVPPAAEARLRELGYTAPDARRAGRAGFAREGDAWGLAGRRRPPSLAASELAKLRGEALPGALPAVDLDGCVAGLAAIRDAVRAGELHSCHDVAEGGLLVAVAECCLAGGVGATLDLGHPREPMARLFGEGPGGFVVSGPREALDELADRVHVDVLGEVGGDALALRIGEHELSLSLDELRGAHAALERLFP
jgi:hypothetical protein